MKKVEINDLFNGWLKYHNTNVDNVVKQYPEEVKSPEWFKLFPVTQEQYNEWETWAKQHIKNITKMSKKRIDYEWAWVCLSCAPHVSIDN
jgi:hypothetical protein